MKLKPDWFLLGMAAAVALAFAFPGPGSSGGWLHPELLTKGGVAVIFFLHGVSLSFAALKAGTLNWRLHLVVQSATFLLFPLLGLLLLWAAKALGWSSLAFGFFYLCALPSTVSSSVALTAAAGGNVAGAVFNATLSSLLGIFLTPLWVSAVLSASGASLPLGKVILDLVIWLLLPLLFGQLARPLLARWASQHKPTISKVDRATILVLVYTSFCDSVRGGVWSTQGWWSVLAATAVSALLFALVMAVTGAVSARLNFSREDRITAQFCGSKKTLASGVPMAQLIFAGQGGLGLILLPIMIYHPLQLLICGHLAAKWSRGAREQAPTA
ncbi:bile acid:sodium symporter family protein [Nibricoccus sp. IMCC34717]|uniref:bile acid:sodium symporter family protein n=1 Tax=Nibricoccus sp. IMCC34717 TaxID=3034021 RepID=UPI00384BF03B